LLIYFFNKKIKKKQENVHGEPSAISSFNEFNMNTQPMMVDRGRKEAIKALNLSSSSSSFPSSSLPSSSSSSFLSSSLPSLPSPSSSSSFLSSSLPSSSPSSDTFISNYLEKLPGVKKGGGTHERDKGLFVFSFS
jgi:hypothetical protein